MDENKSTAPINACIFDSEPQVIKFSEGGESDKKTFSIVAYSGNIIPNHWFWGNVAFDLEGGGIKFDKPKTPVLDSHITSNRMGFTTKQEINDKIVVEGKFLSNPKAQELHSDIKEGFPMQASPFLPPDEVEFVKEGETIEVNGHTLKGPGTVFRKARIKDISFCTFGADNKTVGRVFNKEENNEVEFQLFVKEQDMAKEQKTALTAEAFAAEHPDLFKEVTEEARTAGKTEGKAEGEKSSHGRFKAIAELAPDDAAFAVAQFNAGATVEEAKTALITRLRDQKTEASKQAKEKVDPAHQEFSDDASNQTKATEKPKTPEEKYTAEFSADEKVQAEFGGSEGLTDYIAFRKAEVAGLAKVKNNR